MIMVKRLTKAALFGSIVFLGFIISLVNVGKQGQGGTDDFAPLIDTANADVPSTSDSSDSSSCADGGSSDGGSDGAGDGSDGCGDCGGDGGGDGG
ncbi:MAG: hypothetical protein RI911_147 [Candidatus Parcubacteria bacterium]